MDKSERNLERLRKIAVKKESEEERIKEEAHRFMFSRKFVYKWLKRFRENHEVKGKARNECGKDSLC